MHGIPKGYLVTKKIAGKEYLYLQYTVQGKKKSEYIREEDWGRVKAAVARREPVKEEMNALRREQSRLESAAKILDGNLYRTFVFLKELLKEQKRDQLLLQQVNGDRWVETGYVFTRDNGEPMNPESITGWLSDFSKRHGLRHIHPHMLRHTGASYYIANGIDIATVSRQLGHASVTTTHQFYIHAIEENRAKTADCMADLMYSRTRARTGEGE